MELCSPPPNAGMFRGSSAVLFFLLVPFVLVVFIRIISGRRRVARDHVDHSRSTRSKIPRGCVGSVMLLLRKADHRSSRAVLAAASASMAFNCDLVSSLGRVNTGLRVDTTL